MKQHGEYNGDEPEMERAQHLEWDEADDECEERPCLNINYMETPTPIQLNAQIEEYVQYLEKILWKKKDGPEH